MKKLKHIFQEFRILMFDGKTRDDENCYHTIYDEMRHPKSVCTQHNYYCYDFKFFSRKNMFFHE